MPVGVRNSSSHQHVITLRASGPGGGLRKVRDKASTRTRCAFQQKREEHPPSTAGCTRVTVEEKEHLSGSETTTLNCLVP